MNVQSIYVFTETCVLHIFQQQQQQKNEAFVEKKEKRKSIGWKT